MDVAELISHHILDHDWGITLGGFRLPITTHSVTIFCVSILLFLGLASLAHMRKTRKSARLLTTLAEEYVTFIRDGMVLPNMGPEGRPMLPYFCLFYVSI